MRFSPTEIPDVVGIEPKIYRDDRGVFFETWQAREFGDAGIDVQFVQDNHSTSVLGTLRGLHYQTKNAQGKLVRAVHGEIYDVAVDLRVTSPTFGEWIGMRLSDINRLMLWIPPGFAHGFLVTRGPADVEYKCTEFYSPRHEKTIRWDDADLSIDWPIAEETPPVISEKDAAGVAFRQAEYFG